MFKKIVHLFQNELFFFLFFSLLLLSISISPQIKRLLETPPDRVFSGLEFYSDDYSIYVSNIFQGQRGRWTLLDKHTTEPHEGTIIHDEYLLWGKYTGLFGIDPITSYHLARYTFGFLLLGMVYLFLKEFSPKFRKLAFFLITFATGFVIVRKEASGINLDFHMNWLTEMDNFYRFVALPHYLLGNIFFLGTLLALLKYLNQENGEQPKAKRYLFWGAFCSLMLALIHPVSLVSLMALLGIYLLFTNIIKLISIKKPLILNTKYLILSRQNIFFFVCLVTATPVMLFYRSQFFVPPWNHMAAWEGVTQYYVPLWEFALAIGPTFFLGIVGLISFFIYLAKNFTSHIFHSTLLLFSWIISFFLLIYFSYPYLHISQVRFMQVFIFIPFGIFAASGIYFISNLVESFIKIKLYIARFILFIIVLTALPYYYHSLEEKYRFFTDFSPLIYPFKETVAGYDWLEKNSPADKVVLGAFLAGTQIPYFSNNTVYVGHLWATLNRKEKEDLQNKFLNNQMTPREAQQFFEKNRISYFFYGFQERSYPIQPQNYSFLKPVYQNPSTIIYEVIM